VPQVLAYKRTHATNMSIQYAQQPLGDFRERIDACRELLAVHGSALGAAAPTLDEAHEVIGTQVFWQASAFADDGHMAACDEAMKLAAELAPALTRSAAWRRLRLKRMLPKSIRAPLMSLLRGARATATTPSTVIAGGARQVGWWPSENSSG